MSFPRHTEGNIHRHARQLSLYPPVIYSQVSGHIVTYGLTKTMLLIGTPLMVTYSRSFIHIWRCSKFHSLSRCGPYFFPLFGKWHSQFKKYCAGGMTCDT